MKLRLPPYLRIALVTAIVVASLPIDHLYAGGDLGPPGTTSSGDGLYKKETGTVDIQYKDYDSITFSGFVTTLGSGAVLYSHLSDIVLENNGNILISGNSSTSFGGAFTAYDGRIILSGNDEVRFSANSSRFGGALYAYEMLSVIGNKKLVEFSGNSATTNGGAVMIVDAYDTHFQMEFSGNHDVSFLNNKVTDLVSGMGGAIYVDAPGGTSQRRVDFFNNTGTLTFSGNEAAFGGFMYLSGSAIFSDNNDIIIRGNVATNMAGAIFAQAGRIAYLNNGNITVSDNRSGFGASAISAAYDFILEGNKDVSITNNITQGYGSALFVSLYGVDNATLISADGGNILFDGNMAKGERVAINAVIHRAGLTTQLRATEGKSLTFNDAVIYGRELGKGSVGTGLKMELNALSSHTGRIVFSGENNGGQELKSYLAAETTLYGGTLVIKDRASLNMRTVDIDLRFQQGITLQNQFHNFTVKNGATLEMYKEGALSANQVSIAQNGIIRAGLGASITASGIDMGSGVIYDISQFLGNNDSLGGIADCGLSVTTGSWTMGGNLLLKDSNYAEDIWATTQRFLLFSDVNATHGLSNFGGILSMTTNSDIVSGEQYVYQGFWTYGWDGNEFYAIWNTTAKGGDLWWDGQKPGDGQWDGDGNGVGVWNQDSLNKMWNLNSPDGVDSEFKDNDRVHFTRSGNVEIQGLVNLSVKVKPLGVIDVAFNEGKGDLIWYSNNGGSINGGASLEKRGTGHLIIRTENSFSGGTKMYDGLIAVESLSGLGTGDATIFGGFLDLGKKGVSNKVMVDVLPDSGRHSASVFLAGTSAGSVTVKKDSALNFASGYTFTKIGSEKGIDVEANAVVNIRAGSRVYSSLNLKTSDGVINFVAGDGNTSLLEGYLYGTGTLNVIDGKHEFKELGGTSSPSYEGDLNILGGTFIVSSHYSFDRASMTGGFFVSNGEVRIDSVTIGSSNPHDKLQLVTVHNNDNNDHYLKAGTLIVNSNARLNLEGIIDVTGTTVVHTDAEIFVASNSRLITQGLLATDPALRGNGAGMVVINNGSYWNANGGFQICYIDAREGFLSIGSDSILRKNGYFYAENIVYGTDRDGKILDIGTPAANTPVLRIEQGAEFWAGNTTQVKNESGALVLQTQTGFQCVQLEIEELVTIGTFVVKGNTLGANEKLHVEHDQITASMAAAFTPFFVNSKDTRNYLFVLKDDVVFTTDLVKWNETVHLDTGSEAFIEMTSGAVVNLDGYLTVNGIDYEKNSAEYKGTVTAEGGLSDLTGATQQAEGASIHFMGSIVSSPNGAAAKTTEAEIKLVENSRNPNGYVVKVDTVQLALGETTHIADNSGVQATNVIISGENTILDNNTGKLEVLQEVTLTDTAAYKVGQQDRFGWVNMNEGNLDLTRSKWDAVTLGSYQGTSDETGARVRLNEGVRNNVDARALIVINNEEETRVTEGTTVKTDSLKVGAGSHFDVQGGQVLVRELLSFDAGVTQTGLIELSRQKGRGLVDAVHVYLNGDNHVGIMDSSQGVALIHHVGFNNLEGYRNNGNDTWVFTLTDEMLENQNEGNALAKIIEQSGNDLSKLVFDTSELTRSYYGDIQVYSDNITLGSGDVDYGEAQGTYNQKDAIKNFTYVNPLVPEVSTITINSLWTMVSAMDSVTSAISGQLDYSTYRRYLSRNIWAKAIYMDENIGNGLPGYRKDSGGYAVGADTNLNEKNLIGVSFSQMLGTENTLRGVAEDEQNILMAAVYGRHLIEACDNGSTTLDYVVGYGRADNDARFFKNDKYSSSNWNSNVFDVEAKVNWYLKVSDNVWVNPFVGAEFIAADHEAHDIRGAAGDFDVTRSQVHALRLPIGVTTEYVKKLGQNSSLTPYIGASYVPDILRRNPSATVVNGMHSEYVKDTTIGRNAVRVNTGCTWKLNKEWLINANYEVEAATQKLNQVGRVSVNYTF